MEIVLLISFGIIGGIFGGMGMGGGTVLIPLLTIFLSINQKLAQGYNLLAFLLMAIFAIIIHSKNKLIDLKSIIVLDIFGIIFCVLSVLVAIGLIIRKICVPASSIEGWLSLLLVIIFVGGCILFSLGIIGQYLAKTYSETKKRPIYIEKESNIEKD